MNYFLQFICLVVLACLADVAVAKDALLETVGKHGYLSVNGVDLVDQNGQKVQLKGMALFWSIWYPEFYNQPTVDGVKTYCHSNVIRAALTVDTAAGGYLKDPEGQSRLVEAVIDAAIKDDIYVIVNWQEVDNNVHVAEAKVFFDNISKKYGSHPHIIYEPYNEPIDQSWAGVLKPYYEEVIKTIRANDPNNLIILGPPAYSTSMDVAADDPITGEKNIMYAMHFYSGTHRQWLRDKAEYALSKGLPIFVTEYGSVNADASGPVDVEETRRWYDWLDARGISYVNFSISDKDEAASALKPGTTAAQTCQDAYLTESGRLAVQQNRS
nr:glycoside hydrolase family 5 subfamily 2 [Oxymirus cursor]